MRARTETTKKEKTQTWPITADPILLEQVLINLLFNARDAILARREASPHLPYGGLITITATTGGPGMTAITVADNGGGILPAAMPRIFDPFFTTKPAAQGTGLGLSVAHGIVNAHRGSIAVYSEPNKGSVFHVYLPSAADEDLPSVVARPAAERGSGQRVLYIDDEEL